MSERIKVLLVEDEEVDQMAFSRFVEREGLPYDWVIAISIQEARSILARQEFDIILVDYFLGDETAFKLLEEVHDTPVIVITGLGDEEIAVNAMKLGAADYLTKDLYGNYLKTLPPVIANAIKLKRAENELVNYRQNLEKMVAQRTEELEYLATHDQLTDLPNRMLFCDRLLHALAIAHRNKGQGAILLIDLDDFKAINDAFSHDMGDEYLKIIAGRFSECLRESDTVARIGGDEFAILLENIDQSNASFVANKLNQVLSQPANIRENILVTTASIGISMFPHDGEVVQQLLKNADLAMYRAKESKNTFRFYDHRMTVKVEQQMELTTYIRHALQAEIFQLHYQPQVDSKTGQVVGIEALLRLPHPEKKWISPTEFIPLAERTGQIAAIDEWVLRNAAQKMSELKRAGYHKLSMSVNLSNQQFNQENLINIMKDILRENAFDPGLLELEISESGILRNVDRVTHVMSKLKNLGLKLAIDDFGTGHASLNYLARFPLDRLKVDRSFTKKVLTSRSVSAVVAGVIAIANSLDLGVVVEGVENKEQLTLFSILGCNLIQGYYYSRAVPESKLGKLLRKGFEPFGEH